MKYNILFFLIIISINLVNSTNINISSCINLYSNNNYFLNQSIQYNDTCFVTDGNNISLDCQHNKISSNFSSYTSGVSSWDDHNISIKNCIFSNFTYGVRIRGGSSNWKIDNLEVKNSRNGVFFYAVSNNFIKNSIFYDNNEAIYLWGNSYKNIIENITTSNNNYGIYLTGNSNNNTIYKSDLQNNLISNVHFDTITCKNNTFYQNYLGNSSMIDGNFDDNYFNNSLYGNYWEDFIINPYCFGSVCDYLALKSPLIEANNNIKQNIFPLSSKLISLSIIIFSLFLI